MERAAPAVPLVVVALLAAGAVAPRASMADAPLFGAQTTIVADEPGFVQIRLPESVTISHPESEAQPSEMFFEFDAPGEFAAAVVRAVDADGEGRRAMVTSTTRYRRGVMTHPWEPATLKAGQYRVYVAFDRGPVRVRVSMPQLPGAADLEVTTPVEAVQGTVDHLGTAGAVSRYGRGHELAGESLLLWDLWYAFPSPTPGRKELCIYSAAGSEDAYGPGCPGGTSLDDQGDIRTEGYSDGVLLLPGEYGGIGANFTSALGPPSVRFRAAWLPLARWDRLPERPAAVSESPAATPAAAIPVVSRRAPVRRSRVHLRLACPAGGDACRGRISAGRQPTSYVVRPGGRLRVAVLLPRRARRARHVSLSLRPEDAPRRRLRVRLLHASRS